MFYLKIVNFCCARGSKINKKCNPSCISFMNFIKIEQYSIKMYVADV